MDILDTVRQASWDVVQEQNTHYPASTVAQCLPLFPPEETPQISSSLHQNTHPKFCFFFCDF